MHQYLQTTFAKYKSRTIKILIVSIIIVFIISTIILYFNFFTAFNTILGPKELNENDLKALQQSPLPNLLFRNYFKIHKKSSDYRFNYYFSDYKWGSESIHTKILPCINDNSNYQSKQIQVILNNIVSKNVGNFNASSIRLSFSLYELFGEFNSSKNQAPNLTKLFASLNYSRNDIVGLLQLVTKPEKLNSLIHSSDTKEQLVEALSNVVTDDNLRIIPNPIRNPINLNDFVTKYTIVFLYFKFNNSNEEYIFTSSIVQANENVLNDKNIENFNISADKIDNNEGQSIYQLKNIVSPFKDNVLTQLNLKPGEQYDKIVTSQDNTDEQKLYLSIIDRFNNHKLNESIILNVDNQRSFGLLIFVVSTMLLFIFLELFLFSRLLKLINIQAEDHLLMSINQSDLYKLNQELNNIKVSFFQARVYFTDSFLYLSRFVVPIKYNKIIKVIPKIISSNGISNRTIQIYYKDVNEKIKSLIISKLSEVDMDELLTYIPQFVEKNKNIY